MNKQDRKQVSGWVDTLDEIQRDIETMQEEQEERFDSLPEGIQESERGDAFQEAIETLENAADSIQEAIDYLNEITED